MYSRCWQRVTAGPVPRPPRTHTHTWLQLCLRLFLSTPLPPAVLLLLLLLLFSPLSAAFPFCLVRLVNQWMHSHIRIRIRIHTHTQTHSQIPPKSVYTCKLKHSRGSLCELRISHPFHSPRSLNWYPKGNRIIAGFVGLLNDLLSWNTFTEISST